MSEEKNSHNDNPSEPPDGDQLDYWSLETFTAPRPGENGTSQQQKSLKSNSALMEKTQKMEGVNNNCLSQLDLTGSHGKSITYQPQVRSKPAAEALMRSAGTHHSTGMKNGTFSPCAHEADRKLRSSPSINSQSSTSYSSRVPTAAGDDCCVHCILACLFCEFLTLCNIVLNCAACGSCASDDCCFCCACEECSDCDLPCDMDCGIIDACCESADCLEICMECCGLCFSS